MKGWSVYFWSRLMAPTRVLFVLMAAIVAQLAAGAFPKADVWWWAFGLSFVGLWLASLAVTACPRCGRNAFKRSGFSVNYAWPVATCSRCGLDLKQFTPRDRYARGLPWHR
ncbi:hypothetical protein [uncultured Brevundimonas sp.]|uniref:hypothetical protein n=1 Tax=uncultured Brevundimonas sp. TaxID=213418 RepID=UPI00262920A9|nr:hypothetical protein [uncultured Brevundimonas sp.]